MKQKSAVWRALLYRETRIVMRSPQVLMFIMLPILYAVIYNMIGQQMFTAVQVCISMAVSICGIFVEALLIVAEKETNEWRTLNRAGVSLLTLLGCKTVVTVAISLLTVLTCSIIAGYDLLQVWQLLIVLLPVLGTFVLTGVIVGLAYNSMEEIVLTKWLPVLLLIILVVLPVLLPLQNNTALLAWYKHYPTGILSAAMNVVAEAGSFGMLAVLALKACIWMVVVGGVGCGIVWRERGR
ncbi:hypothetical protein [Cohnella cellulosilytica]|uniref:ABC-2 type transport system permease protein n=1 Tax=Cohnella cellulosilytica TaxID=986710 RepID=A0ABW2FHM3_9BACL